MPAVYDVRNEHERYAQGVHRTLTVADYVSVPTGAFFVNFSRFRDTSRWVTVDRKKPFEVARKGKAGMGWTNYGWFYTLDAAAAKARALDKEEWMKGNAAKTKADFDAIKG